MKNTNRWVNDITEEFGVEEEKIDLVDYEKK